MLERSLVLSSEELHQANAKMRAIFQAIPDLLFRLDRKGATIEINAGTEADLLLASRDLIGKKIQDTPNTEIAALAGLIITFFNGICLEQNFGPDRARITNKIDAFMRLVRGM